MKCRLYTADMKPASRTPRGVRGLKCDVDLHIDGRIVVAPLAGCVG